MTDYTIITNAQVEPEAPVTSELMTSLRDNPIAIAEGATAAPRMAINALQSANTSIRSGLAGWQGGYFIINYEMTSDTGQTQTCVLEFSNDGATFPASLTIDSVSGVAGSSSAVTHLQVDFATGGYNGLIGAGTIGSMPANPTHYRMSVSGTGTGTGQAMVILNGGDAAS